MCGSGRQLSQPAPPLPAESLNAVYSFDVVIDAVHVSETLSCHALSFPSAAPFWRSFPSRSVFEVLAIPVLVESLRYHWFSMIEPGWPSNNRRSRSGRSANARCHSALSSADARSPGGIRNHMRSPVIGMHATRTTTRQESLPRPVILIWIVESRHRGLTMQWDMLRS